MNTYKNKIICSVDCDLPLYASVDVLICGGGPSGIAAAVAAARRGEKTLLVERLGFLGGAAVAGYSGTICGAYLAENDPRVKKPEQIVYGYTDEFINTMKQCNGITEPQLYGKTYVLTHDPQKYKEVAESMVMNAGARILYHTNIIGVIMEEQTFRGVIVDTKSGIAQIRAKVIVDATGDADVIYRAGLSYTMGDNGSIQNPTAMFRLAGVDMDKYYAYWGDDTISPEKVTEMLQKANSQEIIYPRTKVWVFPTTRPGELLMNVTLLVGEDGRALNVCLPEDHTAAEIAGRKQIHKYADFFRKHIPGCENSYINDCSPEVGVRQTRTIAGIDKLKNDDVTGAVKRKDGICKCPWPIELHAGEKPYLFWLIHDYYEVPFGALIPEIGENIIVAGRNLCAEHQALASCRVTAQCFEYGHAAGIAADRAVRKNCAIRDIKGEYIRKEMNCEGSRLDKM